MGLRKILTVKDPALHKVCKPVEKFDWKLRKLLDDMRDTLIDSNGVGLAAPQVGILRRVQNAPPFADIAVITFTGQDETGVLWGAAKFRDSLNVCLKQAPYHEEHCTVLGPAPCVVPKINYNFRYQLTLRCRMSKQLRFLLAHLLREFSRDGQMRGISAFIDINGFDS